MHSFSVISPFMVLSCTLVFCLRAVEFKPECSPPSFHRIMLHCTLVLTVSHDLPTFFSLFFFTLFTSLDCDLLFVPSGFGCLFGLIPGFDPRVPRHPVSPGVLDDN